jgi:F-type H+-transporting ATPase subunit b
MNSRTQNIEDQIKDAEERVKQAQILKDQYEKRLEEAEDEGKKIVQEYRDKAVSLSSEIIEKANTEAEQIRARGKRDVERERQRAQEEIKEEVVSLALMAAEKVVDGQLDITNQHVLIKDFISKVGA